MMESLRLPRHPHHHDYAEQSWLMTSCYVRPEHAELASISNGLATPSGHFRPQNDFCET
jgi:hypothetical protein